MTNHFDENHAASSENVASNTDLTVVATNVDAGVPSMLDEALKWASWGIPIFPCRPDKKPITSSGFKDATTDEDIIRRWWTLHPNALIGMPTGEASGVSVLDLDLRVDGAGAIQSDGSATLQAIMAGRGWSLPESYTVRTPSGGYHIYFWHEEGFTNSAGTIAPGVDTRGEGGYVILPPSRGSNGRKYELISHESIAAADAPHWLAHAFRTHRLPIGGEGDTLALPAASGPVKLASVSAGAFAPDGTHYGISALIMECNAVAKTAEGGRNDRLNKASFSIGQLIESGDLDRGYAEAELLKAALSCGLPESEARRTIQSGLQGGAAKPRASLSATSLTVVASDPVKQVVITANPYSWRPGDQIEPRQWLYEPHLIRGFVAVTVAPGGVGKSSLVLADALAMASGRKLLRLKPSAALNVWVFNLEDPLDEMERRMAATCQHYGISRDACPGGFYLNSGRDTELVMARQDRDGVKIFEPVERALVAELKHRQIDVLIIDPFVSSHGVNENDNNAIDMVAKMWSRVAHEAGCAIELVHHSRKGNGNSVGVDDARGASALVAAARSVRTLNRIDAKLVADRGLDARQPHFGVTYGKANLTPTLFQVEWYAMKSIDLGNGPKARMGDEEIALGSDHIGVVVAVEPAEIDAGLDPEKVRSVQDAIHCKSLRADLQATEWFGYEVARVLELEPDRTNPELKATCKMLIRNGHLQQYEAPDKSRRTKNFVRVGKWVGNPPADAT